MTTVVEDLIDGHVLRDILGGSTISRTFRVSGLTAAPSGQLLEALRDPLVPKVGDVYPGEPTLFVLSVDVRPDGGPAARLTANYSVANRPRGGSWNQPYPGSGNDGQDVKQISSGVREVETYRDSSGAVMLLTPPASRTNGVAYQSSARRFLPVGSVVFERTETEPGTARMRAFVGKLNSSALGAGVYATRTLLFRSFDEQSDDGGSTWNCVYTFDYASSWQHFDSWRDQDGKLPSDGALQTFDVLEVADFSVLNLDFTDGQSPL